MCSLAAAQSDNPQPSGNQPSWLDQFWSLPIFRIFTAPDPSDRVPTDLLFLLPPFPPPPPPCFVAPLDPIEDRDALEFEAGSDSGALVDIEHLTPATALALARFERRIISAGGMLELKSAFRPAAYQEHLQNVWEKWMELRDNQQLGCQDLRAQAGEEFARHRLIETQRPVPVSDHTLGIGFDASVTLPVIRVRRRRVTLDSLARRSGVLRPDIRRDPVHFRLIGGRRG